MTKFEEEFKALTSWDWINVDLIQQILTRFGNWHSDEEFQEKAMKLTFAEEEIEELGDKIGQLKSQLQQQALPVVPECVGEWIDKNISVAHNAELMIHNILICAIDNKNRYLFPLEVEKFVLKNPIMFLNAVITGKYQVEKPQLFYLKNKLTTSYLILDTSTGYFEHWGSTEATGRYKSSFTQQEIGSMETESYEQIEVEK